jgi:TonB family protein
VSDDDIDDALERALGGSESGPVAGPAPPPAGGRPAPTINTAPQRASRAGQPAAQREEPAASAWTDQQAYSEEQEQDDLNDALDDLGIEVAAEESRPISRPQPATQAAERPAADGPAVGVLESPLAFEPPAESGAAIERRENAGTASELELQADLAPAEPEPEPPPAAAPSVPAEPPRVRAEPAPPRAEPAPPRAEPATPAGGDDLDVMLDRAFQGGGPAAPTPAESEPPLEDEGSGPPPFEAVKTPPAPKVPDSLKGMDEGTADLLSSLEELDSSLPSSEPTGWTSTGLTEDVGDRRDDDGREQAPTPEEEASLDAVMERLTSTGIGEEQAPEPGAPASDGSQAAEPEREQPAPQGPPRRKRKIKLGWLFSFFVGMIAVGVSGSMLLLEGDEGGPLPTQIAEQPRSQAFAAGGGGPPPPQPTPEPATAQVSGPDAAGAPPPAEERSMRRIPEEDPVAASPTDEAATEPQTPTPATRPAPRTASLSAEDSPQDTRADPEPARTRAAESGPVPKPAVRTEPDSEPVDPAPSSAEANPAPVQPTPVVGLRDLDQPLNLIESPTPRLAPEAREQGISGRVFVNLLVGPEGTVREVRVMIDPGYGLGQAARDAAARWRYTPPRSHGRPVRVWKTEVVEFDGETPTDANG